ncbi:MAG: hypothetical protein EOO02_22440, partial [Chitinophagaceae bacterium]
MKVSLEQYAPHHLLSPYIEAYWRVNSGTNTSVPQRVMPDGCVDLIINRGEDFVIDDGKHILKHGKIYIGGAITKHMDAVLPNQLNIAGIRFRAGALVHFAKLPSLHEFADGFFESTCFDLPPSAFRSAQINNIN